MQYKFAKYFIVAIFSFATVLQIIALIKNVINGEDIFLSIFTLGLIIAVAILIYVESASEVKKPYEHISEWSDENDD